MRRLGLLLACAVLAAVVTAAGPSTHAADAAKAEKPSAAAVCKKKRAAVGRARGPVARRRARRAATKACLRARRRPVRPLTSASGAPASAQAGVTPLAPAPVAAAPTPASGGARPVAAPQTPSPAPGGPAGPAPCADRSPWLGASARDDDNGRFLLVLTRSCVPAGRVLVQYRNLDLATHNLWVAGVAPAAPARRVTEDLEGESETTAAVDLPQGQWRFFCALEGHESMTRDVSVTP